MIHLPRLISIELTNFDLYISSDNKVLIDLEKPVNCIIGANGLGKSTILNCLNYALTGIINHPGKKFKSVSEFFIGNKYHQEYFEGRISEQYREEATVKVVFEIQGEVLEVTRKFFPNNRVTEFKRSSNQVGSYEDIVVTLTGLSSFDQFAFLQVKVLTFDEERECLFWEPLLLTNALFLTMGLAPEDAGRADELSRQIERANSRIRNLQYEINKIDKRILSLQLEIDEKDISNSNNGDEETVSELNEKYDLLVQIMEYSNNKYLKLRGELDYCIGLIAQKTAEQQQIKSEYDKLYKRVFTDTNSHDLRKHNIIAELYKGICPVCQASDHNVWRNAERKIENHICPLCDSDIIAEDQEDEDNLIETLKSLDKKLAEVSEVINDNVLKSDRLRQEFIALGTYIEEKKLEMLNIEQNPIFSSSKTGSSNVNNELERRIEMLRANILEVLKEKEKEGKKRDEFRDQYMVLHSKLNEQYGRAQRVFIPIFRDLAYKFTGLGVDIMLGQQSHESKTLFSFSLALDETQRSFDHELSESQRFFLDIALRMAIVDYITSGNLEGSMLIDTPEGSLDIAYEVNAGEMFNEYVSRGHQLLITANLNSSGLVKTLAQKTEKGRFNLINILSLANLSIVQRRNIALFERALDDIKQAMLSGE